MTLSLPNPLPVTFGPHEADWWMVAVTALAMAASVVVAVSAINAARQARTIAERSETARLQLESDRASREYDDRLDGTLARLLTAVAQQFDPIREWLSAADHVETHNITDNFGDLAYPERPTMDTIDVEVQLVRMAARDDDAVVARELAHALALVGNQPVYEQRVLLKAIVRVVREWRSGEKAPEIAIAWFSEFQAEKDPSVACR